MFDPLDDLDRTSRLARLAGKLCPLCSRLSPLSFDGRRLRCVREHTWSNPDAAEADIVTDRPRPIAQQREALARAREEEFFRQAEFQARLARFVGDWLPPEARRK